MTSTCFTCMEEAVGQNLLQVGLHCQLGQTLSIHSQLIKLRDSVDLDAGAVLHRQHLRGGALPEDARHLQPVLCAKVLAKPVGTLALHRVVDFLHDISDCGKILGVGVLRIDCSGQTRLALNSVAVDYLVRMISKISMCEHGQL